MAVLATLSFFLLAIGLSSSHPLTFYKNGGASQTRVNVDCDRTGQNCPSKNTCCKTGETTFGCCPEENAVCCPDQQHCCPHGYTCEDSSGKCYRASANTSHPLLQSLARVDHKTNPDEGPASLNVYCPNGDECPSGTTCCKNGYYSYGCCPEDLGVCCSDEKHCCPIFEICVDGGLKCESVSSFRPQLQLIAFPDEELNSLIVECPDGIHECPEGNTCCKTGTSSYGCCPKAHAVCCPDNKHCCPDGYTCEDSDGKCLMGDSVHPLLELVSHPNEVLVPRPNEEPVILNIICPDQKEECSDGSTCCLTASSTYGCCPKANAVCCPDMKHCCPFGYTCEDSDGKCLKGDSVHPLLELVSHPNEVLVPRPDEEPANVLCPNRVQQCRDGDTCCKNGGSSFGCCPKANAVCCPDLKHCCSHGYTCGEATCTKEDSYHPLLELTGSPVGKDDILCPDKKESCAEGKTCCSVGNNKYGCCPKPHAVCCPDMKHCCPEGYTCEDSDGKCKLGNLVHPLLEVAGSPVKKNIECPDKTESCTETQTCCLTSSSKYGCCPKAHAVCCPDMKHCCPEGYTCSDSTGKCIEDDSNSVHPLLELVVKEEPPVLNVVCPDGKAQCPDLHTCCLTGTDEYGCCPKEHAVCCKDKKHCCPEGYTCETSSGHCLKANSYHPLVKLTSRPVEPPPVLNIVCPDDLSECPDKTTCCMQTTGKSKGKYGCCPKANAVCCGGGTTCCPTGYTCVEKTNMCRGPIPVPFLAVRMPQLPPEAL